MEHYEDHDDPVEHRVTFTVDYLDIVEADTEPTDLSEDVATGRYDTTASVVEFDHPNGDRGILIGLRVPAGAITEAFGLSPIGDNARTVVFPLKHKADGGYNFEDYEATLRPGNGDDELMVLMTESQYHQVRSYFEGVL